MPTSGGTNFIDLTLLPNEGLNSPVSNIPTYGTGDGLCLNTGSVIALASATLTTHSSNVLQVNVTGKLRELYQIVGVIYGSQPMKGSADANGKIAMQARALAGAAGAVVNLTSQSCSSCGSRSVGTVTAATSFVINSMNAADVSKVYWEIKGSN